MVKSKNANRPRRKNASSSVRPKSRTKRSGRSSGSRANPLDHVVRNGLNAFNTLHIPLPISTGAYHTVRTTSVFNSDDGFVLLGPMKYQDPDTNSSFGPHTAWSGRVAWGTYDTTTNFSVATLNYRDGTDPFPESSNPLVTCTPAAFSVQVSSNDNLLNASGVVQVGRMPSSFNIHPGETRTADNFANALVSFGKMSTVPVASLVTQPIQVDALPADLSMLQEFSQYKTEAPLSGSTTWDGHGFQGFGPVCLYNPSHKNIRFTVCIEWRVRYDPFNPMHGSGTVHPPTHPGVWHSILDAAHTAGHGVYTVATSQVGQATGQAIGNYMAPRIGSAISQTLTKYAGKAASRFLPYAAEALPFITYV